MSDYKVCLVPVLLIAAVIITFIAYCPGNVEASEHDLTLSEMKVHISSQGRMAIFQLYDTVAAKGFYDQLPLTLELENFRNAQWMFYPPTKLSVASNEAYHDGKKGELSYYAPWGDVFMLYKDFYASDEMHRIGVGLVGIDDIASMSGTASIEKVEASVSKEEATMQINVTTDGRTVVFQLNNSQAAKDLCAQLPLRIDVENYGNNEKIFYPPKKLATTNTPLVKGARVGTLAYYAPWGDVVMFYGHFGSTSGLYELGHAIEGAELIKAMSGSIQIER